MPWDSYEFPYNAYCNECPCGMPLNSIGSSAKSLWNAVRFLWIPLGSLLKCLWYALYALWIPFGSLSKIPFQGPGIHMNSLVMLVKSIMNASESLRIPLGSLLKSLWHALESLLIPSGPLWMQACLRQYCWSPQFDRKPSVIPYELYWTKKMTVFWL